ncbi:Ger(x)C family spore germination protein [Paenibacillus alkalitolerans]|uniref:Ger(x)C family spore germination protein n=1 Tax=Paenibacillus alkalitolerans TaxID=2799335 RepID=UPI0018F50656|nr:Ger(x)C family spore germination protein [Paenibacillus alkalitolerans]
MRRTVGLVLIILVFLSVMTACWSRRELDELAIAVALGIDKKGDRYQVTAQVVNPSEVASGNKKGGGGLGAPTTTITATADTIFEALRRMTVKSPRRIYVAHLRMLVIDEDIAKEGIRKILDFMSRGPEFRTDFYIVIANGVSAEKILRVYSTPQEIIPANNMFASLETAEEAWAGVAKVTLDELIEDLKAAGKQPLLTGVVLTGRKDSEQSETKTNAEKMKPISVIKFQGMAVFNEDKMSGWLNSDETLGYNFIQGKIKNTVKSVSCPDGGKLVLEVIQSETQMKGKVVNGQPQIEIEVRTEENVADVECKIDLMKQGTIYELQSKEEEKIDKFMKQAIKKAQEFRSDIFGFGEAIHRADPRAWKKLKNGWDDHFADVKVNTKIDVNIRRLGTIMQPLEGKPKE